MCDLKLPVMDIDALKKDVDDILKLSSNTVGEEKVNEVVTPPDGREIEKALDSKFDNKKLNQKYTDALKVLLDSESPSFHQILAGQEIRQALIENNENKQLPENLGQNNEEKTIGEIYEDQTEPELQTFTNVIEALTQQQDDSKNDEKERKLSSSENLKSKSSVVIHKNNPKEEDQGVRNNY